MFLTSPLIEQAFTRIDPAICHQLRVAGVTENRVPDHVGARPHDYTQKSLRGLMRDGRKENGRQECPPWMSDYLFSSI